MDNKKLIAVVVVLVILAVFGYMVFAGTKSQGTTSTTKNVSNGGLGSSLGSIWSAITGGKIGNSNCTQGKPSATNPCIDDCGFPISSDINPACV